jgi:hypothetical protein
MMEIAKFLAPLAFVLWAAVSVVAAAPGQTVPDAEASNFYTRITRYNVPWEYVDKYPIAGKLCQMALPEIKNCPANLEIPVKKLAFFGEDGRVKRDAIMGWIKRDPKHDRPNFLMLISVTKVGGRGPGDPSHQEGYYLRYSEKGTLLRAVYWREKDTWRSLKAAGGSFKFRQETHAWDDWYADELLHLH